MENLGLTGMPAANAEIERLQAAALALAREIRRLQAALARAREEAEERERVLHDLAFALVSFSEAQSGANGALLDGSSYKLEILLGMGKPEMRKTFRELSDVVTERNALWVDSGLLKLALAKLVKAVKDYKAAAWDYTRPSMGVAELASLQQRVTDAMANVEAALHSGW